MSTGALDETAVAKAIEPVVLGHDVDLEGVTLKAAGRRTVVTVIVDADGGVDLDRVAEISRSISDVLDADPELLTGAFVLEVTSPGVDRPLTLPQHWRRAHTRLVNISLTSGDVVVGRITDSDGDSATITHDDGTVESVALGDVRHAAVQVEFAARAEEE
ncbi:MAG: ribosome maturation factor RimP [Candidatus Nanopelagicales bacterium]|jgi:ribosome maturation factor RimP|nr:ribosome maturation factor RimP [Candidatus Nanopelagicales bacterium]